MDAWKLNKGDLLERDCPTCGAGHKKIVYKRLTDPGKIDFKNLFLHQVQRPVSHVRDTCNLLIMLCSGIPSPLAAAMR